MKEKEAKLCPCGRGYIIRDPETGISLYTVWLEGSSFGHQEYGDCCKQCEDEQYQVFLSEIEY